MKEDSNLYKVQYTQGFALSYCAKKCWSIYYIKKTHTAHQHTFCEYIKIYTE